MFGFLVEFCKLLPAFCDLIEGLNFTTHKQGLGQGNASNINVFHVELKSILGQIGLILPGNFFRIGLWIERLVVGIQRNSIATNHSPVVVPGIGIVDTTVGVVLVHRYVLVFTKQGDLLIGIQIASQRRNPWQILCFGCFFELCGCLGLMCSHLNAFILLFGHGSAV